jgi:hypothetical protein
MPSRAGASLVVLVLLAGCATPRSYERPTSADAAKGGVVASVLGTPFYALFKATACLVSTVIVVPSSAALALTDRPARADEREALHAGLGHNCFGSYILQPS